MEQAWGNPASKTFRKKHVRQVRMASCTVLVHIELADLVAEILRTAEAAGTQLPETLGGWVPYVSGEDPREFGLSFQVPPQLAGLPSAPVEGWFRYTEPDTGDEYLSYTGTPAEAAEAAVRAEEARVAALNPQVEKPADAWQTCLPGERTLKAGSKGDDVQFIQYALGCVITDGVYDFGTTEAVMALQGRWGQRQTGIMDETAWKALLPTAINHRVEYGDNGFVIRVLQAALLAYDWDDDIVITGRFDQFTLRGVKRLQDNYGIRPSGAMSGPEWAALLGRSVRNV
jgi:peptidoglycan hydrolase-like protein with peptidoglycan-binding domain